VPFNPQVINTGSKLVLIDCGWGVGMFETSKGAIGRTLSNLRHWSSAFTSTFRRWVMWKRTARNIAWCRSLGIRSSDRRYRERQ
jgi:hypothetical protein